MRLALPALLVAASVSPSPHAPGPTHLIAGGKGTATLLLGPELQGAKEASMNLLVLAPGAEVAEHVHNSSAELMYVETGRVEMVIGGRRSAAGPGEAVYVPPGVKHAARVVSAAESVRVVQVYVGPGPEQRFRQGPRLAPP